MNDRIRTTVAVVGLTIGATAAAYAYEDGAPPAHNGGPGGETCAVCHADNEPNAEPGGLELKGLPGHAEPGREYRLQVLLRHPDLRSGGLQASFLDADGVSAGQVAPVDERTTVVSADGVDYLQHTRRGVRSENDGWTRWEFLWRTPRAEGTVTLYLAANASNDDRSALGDYVFTLVREIVIGG